MTAQDRANVRRNPVCASRIPCALHSLHLWATLCYMDTQERTKRVRCPVITYWDTPYATFSIRINKIRVSISLSCGYTARWRLFAAPR